MIYLTETGRVVPERPDTYNDTYHDTYGVH
jgi:hypothetical protein